MDLGDARRDLGDHVLARDSIRPRRRSSTKRCMGGDAAETSSGNKIVAATNAHKRET